MTPGTERDLLAAAQEALAALAAQPGYRRGQFGRAYDEPTTWCLVTEWDSVGAYRRALSAYDVKLRATPLLCQALPEASAFEPLATADPGGPVTITESDADGTLGRSSDEDIPSRP